MSAGIRARESPRLERALLAILLVFLALPSVRLGPEFWRHLSDQDAGVQSNGDLGREPVSFASDARIIRRDTAPGTRMLIRISISLLGIRGPLALSLTLLTWSLIMSGGALNGGAAWRLAVLILAALAASHWLETSHLILSLAPLTILTRLIKHAQDDPPLLSWAPFVILAWAWISPSFILGFVMIGLAVGHDGTTNQSNRAPALVMAGLASLILLAVTRSLVPLLAGATYDLNQRILLDVGSIDRPLAVAPILFGAVWLLGWRCRDGGLQAIHGSMIILATVSPSFTPFAILTAIPMLLEDSGTRTESRWTAFSILVLIGIVGGLVSSRSGFDLEENRLADLPAVLRNIPARGNLYLERDWGDFLARCPWVRPPMVTSDTRAYTNGVLEDHEKILLGANQDLLNAYGIDTVIVRPDRPLARTLQHVPGWVVNGQNDDRIILTRWTWFQGGPPPYIEFPQRPN